MKRYPQGGFPRGPGRFAGRFLVERHEATWLVALHTIMPFLVVLALAVLVAWVVLRVSADRGRPLLQPAGAMAGHALAVDPALDEVRMRYARGDIDQDEFVRRSNDLGGVHVPPPAQPPDPSEAAAET